KPEDVDADSASDNIGGCDLVLDPAWFFLAVDGADVVHNSCSLALCPDFGDGVPLLGVDLVHHIGRDINKDDLVAGLVEEQADKATADGAAAEMDGFFGVGGGRHG